MRKNAAKPIIALIGLVSLVVAAPAHAQSELRELYRGARAQAMGNAFTAVADDEEALYYNPAGLAGNTSTTLQYVALDLETSTDVVTSVSSSISQFKDLSTDTLNILIGKDIYLRGTYAPTLLISGFGVGVLADQQLSLITKNKAMPAVNLGYQTTNGIQVGYGMSLGNTRRRKTRGELRVGIGLKMLFRRGGYYDLTQKQIINMSQNELKQIVGDFGHGFGWDLGTQYIHRFNHRISLMTGAAYTEVGGVKFGDTVATPLPGNLSAGIAARYQFAQLSATLAYDYRHINESVDPRLRQHFGAELAIPIFKFYAGLNQVYPTYGFGIDLGLISVTAVSYAEEMSSMAKIDPERRYLLHLSMSL